MKKTQCQDRHTPKRLWTFYPFLRDLFSTQICAPNFPQRFYLEDNISIPTTYTFLNARVMHSWQNRCKHCKEVEKQPVFMTKDWRFSKQTGQHVALVTSKPYECTYKHEHKHICNLPFFYFIGICEWLCTSQPHWDYTLHAAATEPAIMHRFHWQTDLSSEYGWREPRTRLSHGARRSLLYLHFQGSGSEIQAPRPKFSRKDRNLVILQRL